MTVSILPVDNGRKGTKVYIPHKNEAFTFPSLIGEWHDRTGYREIKYGNFDLEIEYLGRKYFGGTLAEYESAFGATMHTHTKDNIENLINILTALHLTLDEGVVKIITCQPIKSHTDENKKAIKEMLMGRKSMTINGVRKDFTIMDVAVACEAGVAAYSLQSSPKTTRILDFGSSTVNAATLKQNKFVRLESDTFYFGLETQEYIDEERMASKVISEVSKKKWDSTDPVVLVGGGAEKFLPHIKEHFHKAQAHPNAEYANVIGMWKVAKSLWQ